MAGSRVPYVFVNRRVPGSGRNVYMRETDAGRLAAEHLIGLGHVALAQIAGPLGLDTASRRAAGFADAVVSAGLPLPALVESPFDERGAFEAMEPPAPVALTTDGGVRIEPQPGDRRARVHAAQRRARPG